MPAGRLSPGMGRPDRLRMASSRTADTAKVAALMPKAIAGSPSRSNRPPAAGPATKATSLTVLVRELAAASSSSGTRAVTSALADAWYSVAADADTADSTTTRSAGPDIAAVTVSATIAASWTRSLTAITRCRSNRSATTPASGESSV